MKVNILQAHVLDAPVADKLEAQVVAFAKRLERVLKGYSKPLHLDVHVSKVGRNSWRVAYSLNMKNGQILYASEKADDVLAAAEKLEDKFVRLVRKHRAEERHEALRRRWQRKLESLIAATPYLDTYKEEGEREAFVQLLSRFLPEVTAYVRRRLRMAEAAGLVPKGMFRAEGLADEVWIRAWDRYGEEPLTEQNFKVWIYRLAEEVLDETLEEAKKEKELHTVSIEEWTAREMKEMEEHFSADADGDLVLIEELDDISYHLDEYDTDDFELVDAEEEELIKKIEEEAAEDNIPIDRKVRRRIKMALARLPMRDRSIFDLHVLQGLTVEEIAQVKRLEVAEVENIIASVRQRVKQALLKWRIVPERVS